MNFIESVSSLNLRGQRGDSCRNVEEDIMVECDGCKETKRLGSQTCAMTRIKYGKDEKTKELTLCDVCTDVFVDAVRFGAHVVKSPDTWKRKSFTRRVTAVHDELLCFTCLKDSDSHIGVRFITSHDIQSSKRICARCASYYLELIDDADFTEADFEFIAEDEDIGYAGGRIEKHESYEEGNRD